MNKCCTYCGRDLMEQADPGGDNQPFVGWGFAGRCSPMCFALDIGLIKYNPDFGWQVNSHSEYLDSENEWYREDAVKRASEEYKNE